MRIHLKTATCRARQTGGCKFADRQPSSGHCSSGRHVAAQASKRFSGFDYQLGWPYVLIPLEVAAVALQWRLPLAVMSVLLVLFQTPTDNALLKWVADLGAFARYKDAKFFCGVLTASTFTSFLVVSYVMART